MSLTKTYTLVDPVSGIPCAQVDTSDERTLEVHKEKGFTIIEGSYDGSWRLVNGQMVKAAFPFAFLREGLAHRIQASVANRLSEGIEFHERRYSTTGEGLTKLWLASQTQGNNIALLTEEGRVEFVTKQHLNALLAAVAAMFEAAYIEIAGDLEDAESAGHPDQLAPLLAKYWPDLGGPNAT